MTGVALVVALAGLIEGIQELALGRYLHGWAMQLVSWGLGIGLCFLLQVGLFSALGLVDSVDAIRFSGDMVFTGLVVGLGANGAHMVLNRFRE